jgi:hypothetical protein
MGLAKRVPKSDTKKRVDKWTHIWYNNIPVTKTAGAILENDTARAREKNSQILMS